MTTFLWILTAGFILGIVFFIIFSLNEKTKILALVSMCISIVSAVCFVVDITVEPVKNIGNNVTDTQTQTNDINSYIDGVDYSEIYNAYKENELRADDKYKNNRYKITAKVDGMTKDGILNFSGNTTVTLEHEVDNTIVILYATFGKDQDEALKSINTGDTITFEGECLSEYTWTDCKLIN